MEITYRLEKLEVGRPVHVMSGSIMGMKLFQQDIEEDVPDPNADENGEVVRATFGRKGGHDWEIMEISLTVEEAKMYMIGHEYVMTIN